MVVLRRSNASWFDKKIWVSWCPHRCEQHEGEERHSQNSSRDSRTYKQEIDGSVILYNNHQPTVASNTIWWFVGCSPIKYRKKVPLNPDWSIFLRYTRYDWTTKSVLRRRASHGDALPQPLPRHIVRRSIGSRRLPQGIIASMCMSSW